MRAKTRSTASSKSPRRSFSASRHGDYIFVYGTLKRGEKSHRELSGIKGVRFVGEARIKALLFQLPRADYPGAVPTAEDKYVYGQLFSIQDPERTLKALDKFEEVDEGLFRRKMVDAWAGSKRTRAWTYFYAGSVRNANPLVSGVYS